MSVDPGTALVVLGTALGSKEIVVRMLGPTADYLGDGMRFWTEQGVKNLCRVFDNARKKLGPKLNSPGSVPPKVLKGILQDGPFCDDELGADYFGGVLASSRTESGRDDRGAVFLALIGRLSTYQIRSHFFFYSMVRIIYEGLNENIGVAEGRHKLKTFVPFSAYAAALEFSAKENPDTILPHVMFGLLSEALIEGGFSFGSVEHVKPQYAKADEPGLIFTPSALGFELFLWAHGRGDTSAARFLDPSLELTSDVTITTTSLIRSTFFPERTFPKAVGEVE